MTDAQPLLDPWEEAQQAQAPAQPPQSPTMEPWEEAQAAGLKPDTSKSPDASLKPQDWISKVYHPAIVGTGMTVGGSAGAIAGAPAGPIASGLAGAAGAASMYPPANAAANSLDQMRGMQSPPTGGVMSELETGAEVEAGGKVLGAAIGAAAPVVKRAIIKSISSVFGPSTDAIEAWLQNPSLPNAPDVVTLARKLPQTLNNLKGLISQATEKAGTFLSDSSDPLQGAIPKIDLLKLINKESENLATGGQIIGQANQVAADHLEAIKNSLVKLSNDNLPQTTVKSLIKAMDNNINFADRGASATNNALANIRSGANQLLKSNNPEYATAMKEVSGMMGTLEDTQKAFGITNEIGQGLQPSDKTISAFQGINKATRSISKDTLNDLANLTGDDYVADAQNAKWAQEFKKGFPAGSRRVNWGEWVGGAVGAGAGVLTGHPYIGGLIGGAAGSTAGGIGDTYGGPLAAVSSRLIQQLSKHIPTDLATRIVANVFAPETTPQQNQGSGQ